MHARWACAPVPRVSLRRLQGWRWSRSAPLSFLCAWSVPLPDCSHVDPGDSGSSLGACWYFPRLIFPFLYLALPWRGDLLSERCLFCDDWHSVPCSPACLRCAASLSAFQARPSLLCASLSFTPFPTSVSVALVADFFTSLSEALGAHWPLWAWRVVPPACTCILLPNTPGAKWRGAGPAVQGQHGASPPGLRASQAAPRDSPRPLCGLPTRPTVAPGRWSFGDLGGSVCLPHPVLPHSGAGRPRPPSVLSLRPRTEPSRSLPARQGVWLQPPGLARSLVRAVCPETSLAFRRSYTHV